MTIMLCDLIHRKLPSKLIVIQDSVEHSGICLWKSFVKQTCSEKHTVFVLCLDNNKARLKLCEGPGIQINDTIWFDQDWTGPLLYSPFGTDNSKLNLTGSLINILRHSVSSGETNGIVLCIDSLSSLILKIGLSQCYRDLQKILSEPHIIGVPVKQIISLVHEDTLMNRELALAQLKHLASSFVYISEMNGRAIATTTHTKPGGKILKVVEQFHINDDLTVHCEKLDITKNVSSEVQNEPKSTFRLELRNNEKEARSQLVLPYLRRENAVEMKKAGGGEIFYQLEESDDWDEEDPDDDLDV